MIDLKRGPISWMATNPVAANLLMAVFVLGGVLMAREIKQEVFPDLDFDTVTVSVVYPGASPAEVEQGVVLAIEEAVRGIDGVKRIKAGAGESLGVVRIELLLGADDDRVLADVKSAVDRIRSFPGDAERPIVALASRQRSVISLVVYGDEDEATIRAYAERARDELLQDPDITRAEIEGARPLEVSIEVPQDQLRAHGLSLPAIAAKVRQSSVELPAGGLKTAAGEVLLRTDERRDVGLDFEEVRLVSSPTGGHVRLGDIASIRDGFSETDDASTYNGKRALMVTVYRVGEETPQEVADATHEYIARTAPTLPPSLSIAFLNDRSEVFRDRSSWKYRRPAGNR